MKRRRIVLVGYKIGSASLKNLQQQIKELRPNNPVLRVARDSTRYVRRPRDVVITWGPTAPCTFVDPSQDQAKAVASNKLDFFKKVAKWNSDNRQYPNLLVSIPEWTEDKATAQTWFDNCETVVARALLNSHSGKGISLHNGENSDLNPYFIPLPNVPLYVKYKKKKHEFRVHVYNGAVIDVSQKKRKAGFENRDNQIRNHQNGWVYCREDIQVPAGMDELAVNTCLAIGLNSGAVDIIYNERENQCYVLEVNTAPGVEGTTCLKYAEKMVEGV